MNRTIRDISYFIFHISYFIFPLCLGAGEFVIAERGKTPSCTIVTAEYKDFRAPHLETAAKNLQQVIFQATGVKLPVVKESAFKGGRAIRLGNGKLVPTPRYQRWEYRLFVKNGDLFLAGQDLAPLPRKYYGGHYTRQVLGSLKASLEFTERFCHTTYPMPGVLHTPRMTKIAVPDTLNEKCCPKIFCRGSSFQTAVYDIANNYLSNAWFGTYGGHTHNVAVPVDKFFKSHPEYFAVIRGKRYYHKERPQYCLSHPAVREMIYQELLSHADQGYTIVPLGQSDGFVRCRCPECQKQHGKMSSGELLWELHLQCARRFLKDRPGKKLCIIAYGPTVELPKVSALPENVMIELAPCSQKILDAWSRIKVPGGFAAYLYNWGGYQAEGFTPKCASRFLELQTKMFLKHNVQILYLCGCGELFGLEGPQYFEFGKRLGGYNGSSAALLKRYCRSLYGKSAGIMEKFFTLLDSRVALGTRKFNWMKQLSAGGQDWNDPELLSGNKPRTADNLMLLAKRYPDSVVDKLDSLLAQAEKLEPQNTSLKMARTELDYLKVTARQINALIRYRETLAPQEGRAFLKAIAAREAMIASIPVTKKGRIADCSGIRHFAGIAPDRLITGGRLTATQVVFFHTLAPWMLKYDLMPSGRSIKPDGKPQLLVSNLASLTEKPGFEEHPSSIAVSSAEKGLNVDFFFTAKDQLSVRKDLIMVYFGRKGQERRAFAARACNDRSGDYIHKAEKSKLFPEQNYVLRNIKDSHVCQVTAPVPGSTQVSARFFIPWSAIGGRPAPGETCLFNAVHNDHGNKIRRVWNFNIYQVGPRQSMDLMGTLEF